MIGQKLNNRYEVTTRLGKGAMGIVYRAVDMRNGRDVAVKIISNELAVDPAMLERFKREGQALRSLRHRNIIEFMDAFEQDERYVIIMEYVSGGSLYDLIQQSPLPVERAIQIAIDLCDALTSSHRLKIIHRDIKPENILIDKDGTPKLADFGIAHLSEGTRMTRSSVQVGTPYYMSPEAWEGRPLDAQADIWSLGVLLFEMLMGHVPFGGDTPLAVMNRINTTPPPNLKKLRSDVPPGLAKIISRMLTRNKQRRYQTMREVAVDLEREQESIQPLTNPLFQQLATSVTKLMQNFKASHSTITSTLARPFLGLKSVFRKVRPHFWIAAGIGLFIVFALVFFPSIRLLIVPIHPAGTAPIDNSEFFSTNSSVPTLILTKTQIFAENLTNIPVLTTTAIVTSSPIVQVKTVALGKTIKDVVWVRTGPGEIYRALTSYNKGVTVTIVAKSRDEKWLVIELEDEDRGWVSSASIEIIEPAEELPIATAPPTQTPIPTPPHVPGEPDPCAQWRNLGRKIQRSIGSSQGDPNYDPGADLNGDGSVDIFDYNIWIGAPPSGCQ